MFHPMVSTLAATVIAALAVSPGRAQNSESFQRTKQSLARDRAALERTRIDLHLRLDAMNTQVRTLNAKAAEIRVMPDGIGKSAAIQGYNRDRAAWEEKRDQYNIDRQRYSDDATSYNERLAEYNRRVQAANEANQFRVGQSVLVEWHGEWWDARVLRAENGHYYVTYPGYGSEWDEWVGGSRISRR